MDQVLGRCPWCLVNVLRHGTSGMEPVEHTIVHGEPRWWHQGCIADLYRSEWENA